MIGRAQSIACATWHSTNLVSSKFHDANDDDDNDTAMRFLFMRPRHGLYRELRLWIKRKRRDGIIYSQSRSSQTLRRSTSARGPFYPLILALNQAKGKKRIFSPFGRTHHVKYTRVNFVEDILDLTSRDILTYKYKYKLF